MRSYLHHRRAGLCHEAILQLHRVNDYNGMWDIKDV